MTGTILRTTMIGGLIADARGGRWLFAWRDAIDFRPNDVGSGNKVAFSPGETRGTKQFALSVRRND